MAKKKEFTSYYSLTSEMAGVGLNTCLQQALDLEIEAEKDMFGKRVNREKIQERIVDWFNQPATKGCCDLTDTRVAYCMVDAMKKKYAKKKRR